MGLHTRDIFLKINCVHSRLNVNILASQSVPFRPTTVQVPNLALTWHETDNSAWLNFFYVLYSTLLHLPPLRFHCVGGCWDRTRTVATLALAVRQSNYSARSHAWSAGWLYCAPADSQHFLLFRPLHCTENYVDVYLDLRPASSLFIWICARLAHVAFAQYIV